MTNATHPAVSPSAAVARSAARSGPAAGASPRRRFDHLHHADRAMGGRLDVHLACEPTGAVDPSAIGGAIAARVRAWERRLTRFSPDSELSRVNADTSSEVPISPTLAAVLEWASRAGRLTDAIVDVTMLDERLVAERGSFGAAAAGPEVAATREAGPMTDAGPSWRLLDPARAPATGPLPRGGFVARPRGLRLDFDGVAKGWIADRALDLLAHVPGAVVDADGDIAVRVAAGDLWEIGVADPRTPGFDLAVLRLETGSLPLRLGVATSGVTVHRWPVRDGAARTSAAEATARHHLIDPRTRRPAATDLLQVTVLARDARTAEALAKAAVILGAADGTAFLEASPALGAVLLPETGGAFALTRTLAWLS